jgi:hypothetical protein
MSTPEGGCHEEGVFHVQKVGQEAGGAEDSASAGAQNGADTATAVDLFSPLPISGYVNKRSTGKAWGVIFVCTSTSLAHVEIAETYSTESFKMTVRRFMALHGAPKRFQSDQRTQLVAASKQLATWDWTAVHEVVE